MRLLKTYFELTFLSLHCISPPPLYFLFIGVSFSHIKYLYKHPYTYYITRDYMERVQKPKPGFCQRVKTIASKAFGNTAKNRGGQDNITTPSTKRSTRLSAHHWDLMQRRKADTLQELREAQKRTENDIKRLEREKKRYE